MTLRAWLVSPTMVRLRDPRGALFACRAYRLATGPWV